MIERMYAREIRAMVATAKLGTGVKTAGELKQFVEREKQEFGAGVPEWIAAMKAGGTYK